MNKEKPNHSVDKRNMIIASTSTIYGGKYLDYLLSEIKGLFQHSDTVIFIPFARPGGISYDEYTTKASSAFEQIGKKLIGLHTLKNPIEAIKNAGGVFTGGGNTFVLVKTLYEYNLIEPLRKAIFNGLPYMGSSAGSNICGVSMKNTNDMPIVYPPSYKTLGAIPFNINPHYLDPNINSKHMGETRETRIKEFHSQNSIPVVGLREGSWIRVKDGKFILKGDLSARIFEKDKQAFEIEPGTDIKFK